MVWSKRRLKKYITPENTGYKVMNRCFADWIFVSSQWGTTTARATLEKLDEPTITSETEVEIRDASGKLINSEATTLLRQHR